MNSISGDNMFRPTSLEEENLVRWMCKLSVSIIHSKVMCL